MYHNTLLSYSKANPIDIKHKPHIINSIHGFNSYLSPSTSRNYLMISHASSSPYYFTKKKYIDDINISIKNTNLRFETYFPELYEKIKNHDDVIDELMFYNTFPYRGDKFKTYIYNKILLIIDKYKYDEETTDLLIKFMNEL